MSRYFDIGRIFATPADTKLRLVQFMRFVAAFSVVICHNTFYTHERLNPEGYFYSQGARGVALFFVISGFVMLISTSREGQPTYDWRRFVLRRLARIAPLYWFATTVKVLVLAATSGLVLHAALDIPNIVKSYFFIPSRNIDGEIQPFLGVGWTLIYEMFFYIVFALALYLRRDPFIFTSTIMVVLSILSLFRSPSWPDMAYFLADPVVLDFVMGMIIAKIVLAKKEFDPRTMIALMFAGLFVLFQPFGLLNWVFDNSILGQATSLTVGFFSFLIILAAVALEDRYGHLVPGWVLFFGAASYSLYLMHPMAGPIAPELVGFIMPFAKDGLVWFWMSAILGMLFSLAAGAAVYLLFEVPVTDNLNRRINSYLERQPKLSSQRQV